MSYTVAGRTREFGVRVALGASRADVLRLVLLEGLALAGVGLAIGIPISLTTSRVLSSVLYELSTTDPVSLLVGIGTLAAVAMLAGYIPARRATKVDPMVALRYE
jgi:ABC-type antimicrobial peptide transport system permease subunit